MSINVRHLYTTPDPAASKDTPSDNENLIREMIRPYLNDRDGVNRVRAALLEADFESLGQQYTLASGRWDIDDDDQMLTAQLINGLRENGRDVILVPFYGSDGEVDDKFVEVFAKRTPKSETINHFTKNFDTWLAERVEFYAGHPELTVDEAADSFDQEIVMGIAQLPHITDRERERLQEWAQMRNDPFSRKGFRTQLILKIFEARGFTKEKALISLQRAIANRSFPNPMGVNWDELSLIEIKETSDLAGIYYKDGRGYYSFYQSPTFGEVSYMVFEDGAVEIPERNMSFMDF